MNHHEGVGSSTSSSSGPRAGFKKLFSDIATIASKHDNSSSTTELDNYYNEKPLPKDMKLDLLMWWKTNGSKYPTLQRIAKDILAIPVSTVASESAFSTSGRLISPHRSRLHPKTLEALMCAQSWLLNEIRGNPFFYISYKNLLFLIDDTCGVLRCLFVYTNRNLFARDRGILSYS